MRKILTTGLAALALAGTTLGAAAPATAQDHHGFRGDFRGDRGFHGRGFDHDDGGIALAAGVIGLGLGAALASHPYYDYGPGPSLLWRRLRLPGLPHLLRPARVWDPYVGHYVIERVRYAC